MAFKNNLNELERTQILDANHQNLFVQVTPYAYGYQVYWFTLKIFLSDTILITEHFIYISCNKDYN